MSDDEALEVIAELFASLMVALAPVLLRAYEANLVSPTEQAELATIQASLIAMFVTELGGTAEELAEGERELRARILGGS